MFTESLASLTHTSASSGDETRQHMHEHKYNEEDDNSLCGSLTYSVESERPTERHRREDLTPTLHDITFTTYSNFVSSSTFTTQTTADPKQLAWLRKERKNHFDCFEHLAGDKNNDEMNCFHPLAWLGLWFHNLVDNMEEKNIIHVEPEGR
jgi:hypothetical protein